MSKQLTHDTPRPGTPCLRCGVKSKRETAYLPCFEEGDDLQRWVARHAELLLMLKDHVPELLQTMAESALKKSLESLSCAHRLAALLIQIHYLRADYDQRDLVEERAKCLAEAKGTPSRNIDLDWRKFAEECLQWLDPTPREGNGICSQRESGGARCEREEGHSPPCACPKALAEFEKHHASKKEKDR